jgi:hypothetical protein
MRLRPIFLLLPALCSAAENSRPLDRVAEEAEVFQQNIPNTISQETLEQRTLLPPSRFRPRAGADTVAAGNLRMSLREVISEYVIGPLRQADVPTLVELRQILSVDGRKIQGAAQARRTLSLGIRSGDDRLRKRMLEDFAKQGLVDLATDYGLILLAFTKRGLSDMTITDAGEAMLGAERARVYSWAQNSNESGELEFRARKAVRRALRGALWVTHDGLPLRIQAWAEYTDAKGTVRDEGTVEYTMSQHGFLVPASVVHRHFMDGSLVTENLFHYEPFKKFSADAEIKFTEVPDTPPK